MPCTCNKSTLFSNKLSPSPPVPLMATDHNSSNQNLTSTHPKTIFRWPKRHRIQLRRRKVLPTVRLGGKKPRRGLSLARLFRRVQLRWLKLKYSCMLKKLKEYYRSVIRDLMEAGGTVESFQQRIQMETSFAVPVMGMSFSTFPNTSASDRI